MDESKLLSFLQPRDPSIVSWSGFIHPKTKLFKDLSVSGVSSEQENLLATYLRIKSKDGTLGQTFTIQNKTLICKVPEGTQTARNVREGKKMVRKYEFTEIFNPLSSQECVFNKVVREKLLHFLGGRSCTLMSYGASGSGKTFTIFGNVENPGVIPRALDYIFRTLPKLPEYPTLKMDSYNVTALNDDDGKFYEAQKKADMLSFFSKLTEYPVHLNTYVGMQSRLSSEIVGLVDRWDHLELAVYVSFYEIYNESVYDLLTQQTPRPRLRVVKDSDGHYRVRDLTAVYVSSGLDAYQILQYGMHNLRYAATNVNCRSSRAHSVFIVWLLQRNVKEDKNLISSFSFCDLAGSERAKKTANRGERLKESTCINSSLHVLGRCIAMLKESQRRQQQQHQNVDGTSDSAPAVSQPVTVRPPFRDSKFTMLFQRALSGDELVSMVVNIADSVDQFDESINVLNFSAMAKSIELVPAVKCRILPTLKSSKFSQLLETHMSDSERSFLLSKVDFLENEVERLREQVNIVEVEARKEVCGNMGEYIARLREDWSKEIDAKRLETIKLQIEVETLKAQLNSANTSVLLDRNSLREPAAKRKRMSSIIEINDSCDEDENRKENAVSADSCKKCASLQQLLDEAIIEYKELLKKNESLENQLEVLALEMDDLKTKTECEHCHHIDVPETAL